MKFRIKALLLLSVFSVLSNTLLAQGGNPGGPGACFPPPCVPITDHIGWLIALMVGFGLFKTIQYSRKTTLSS